MNPRQVIIDRFPEHEPHIAPAFMYPNGDPISAAGKNAPYVAREPRVLSAADNGPVKVRCGCGKMLKFSSRPDAFRVRQAEREIAERRIEVAAQVAKQDAARAAGEKVTPIDTRVPTPGQVRKFEKRMDLTKHHRNMTFTPRGWVPTASLPPEELPRPSLKHGRRAASK